MLLAVLYLTAFANVSLLFVSQINTEQVSEDANSVWILYIFNILSPYRSTCSINAYTFLLYITFLLRNISLTYHSPMLLTSLLSYNIFAFVYNTYARRNLPHINLLQPNCSKSLTMNHSG